MPRRYVPYPEKHKWPKGFGSLCPKDIPPETCQALLDQAIAVQGVGTNKLWVASGRWCFCAHPSTSEGPDVWHGFPVIGGEVDERVWTALVDAGLSQKSDVHRLRRQRTLPEVWP